MTRFARAKGSKASNERIPEESTPWTIMKQQLLENINNSKNEKHEQEVNEQKIANYKNFLKEKEEEQSKHSVWASFPVQRNKSLLLNNKSKKSFKNKISNNETVNISLSDGKRKNKEKKLKIVIDEERKFKESNNSKNQLKTNVKEKKKDKKPKLQNNESKVKENTDLKNEIKFKKTADNKNKTLDNQDEKDQENLINGETGKKKKGKKRKCKELSEPENNKKGTKHLKKEIKVELTDTDLKKIEKKKQKRFKQLLKKKQFKEKLKEQKQNEENLKVELEAANSDKNQINVKSSDTKNEDFSPKLTTKKNKNLNNEKRLLKNKKNKHLDSEHQRKKSTLPHKMFINGKELEIAYVEGFPVKKEDAERLKKLRKEMISKGLPRSQIDVALKLERRRAEKALAREKKKVCFNCRKSGHNLSECPELGKNQFAETTGSGICFKCGSTEHTHFECKVVRGLEYKFAQCFICNEQGHIARQCPDNARGLYPKGGACKVCGDVTHLKKDCPQYQAQQEKQENNVMIQTLGNSNPEMLDGTSENTNFSTQKKQNKIIKFV